jgi:hypothetical protein
MAELTDEQMAFIKDASKGIDFGKITVSFYGAPKRQVSISAERVKHFEIPTPTTGEATDRKKSGRY